MEENKDCEEKNIKRKVAKKLTFHEKDNKFILNKKFEKSIKPELRCYSTKLVSNFVPQLKPKKSFCKPTFFQLNENETKSDDENGDNLLDAISSCEEVDDDSVKSSSLSSSDDERNEEEEKNNITKFSLENNTNNIESKLYNEDFSLNKKKEQEEDICSSSDEYDNLAFKKKKKSKKQCEDKDNLKTFRKDMSKIKSTSIDNKSKEMEINIHQNFKEEFNLGENDINKSFKDENNNKKSNDIHKKLNKFRQSNNNFSILDILSIKNGQN